MTSERQPSRADFTAFARDLEPKLRYALAGTAPSDDVQEAVQDALVYAWRHWERVSTLANPGGYLYRVARRKTWRRRRRPPLVVGEGAVHDGYTGEPHLPRAMATLSASQRKVVFLVEGLGLSQREVADLLSVRRSTVRTHLNRGISKLREAMGVTTDV